MKKKLTHNFGLKLASLVLACMLWFLVAELGDPKDTKSFSNVPVRLLNANLLTDENKIYEVLDNSDTVRVSVYAPRSVTDNLRASDIVAEADVSKLTDINTVAITYRYAFGMQNAEEHTITGDHDVVKLNVEERESKWIRLNYLTVGDVAEGYVITSSGPDQTQIEVTGPKSVIDRVNFAYVELDVTGATTNMSANVEYSLYDKDNQKMDQSRITKNVDQVRMSVEVMATKDVPVELSVKGQPAEGYLATGVREVSLEKVQLAGTPAQLANISRISIPADELDLTDATDTLVKTFDLKSLIPENIKLVDTTNSKITVTVYVEPLASRTLEIPMSNLHMTNVPEGFEVEPADDDETYSLEITGLETRLNGVVQNGVLGQIDIKAWMESEEMEELEEGTYKIPVTFNLENGINVSGTTTLSVVVKNVSEE